MKFSSAILLSLPVIVSAVPTLPVGKRITDLAATKQNDLVNGLPCKPLTVIFARGTVSPGNVGEDVGPPFFAAIAAKIGIDNLAVQGVDYLAGIFGFLGGGDNKGTEKLLELTLQALTQCPNTKLVISGYSQGAQLVHNAARQYNETITAKISSVVNFGDPFKGSSVGMIPVEKVLTICHKGDNICDGGILVLPPHRNYNMDAGIAADFVIAQAGL